MVDLILAIACLWLLVSVVHRELRRRAVLLARERHRERTELARARAEEQMARLGGERGSAASSRRDGRDALPLEEPTGAQLAEWVSPRPADPLPVALGQVQRAVRERPEAASTATRRIPPEPRRNKLRTEPSPTP